MRAYGAEIVRVTEPDPETGEWLVARLNMIQRLLDERPGALWTNQYASEKNVQAHSETTMPEIVEALGKAPSHILVSVSTCGTIMGCADHIAAAGYPTTVVAVDASGSQIFGSPPCNRVLPGMGAGVQPPLLETERVDQVIHINEVDSIAGCRMLVRRESLLCGASSGGVVAALHQLSGDLKPGDVCVMLLPDRGERYLDTVYSDEWVREHIGGDALERRLEVTQGLSTTGMLARP